MLTRGRAVEARQAHNLEVVGSSPTPATIFPDSKLLCLAPLILEKHCYCARIALVAKLLTPTNMPLTDQPVKGMYILEEGRVFLLQERKLKTQGRQGGLIILKLRALDNGQILTKTIKAGTKVEYINPETKEMQFLYSDPTGSYFMDSVSFETIMIPNDVIGTYVNFLKEGDSTLVMMYEGKVLTVKENSSVNLTVVESEDAVKGNTSNTATKLVTVETGYKLHVPLFVKKGDVLKINTESGTYSGKAS